MIEQRKCHGACGEWLPLDSFGKDAARSSGLRNQCRACHNAANRRRYEKVPRVYEKDAEDTLIHSACNLALNGFRAAEPANHGLFWRVA